MATRRKYQPGTVIASMSELDYELEARRGVYLRGKWLHYGWVSSMQFRALAHAVRSGVVRRAEPTLSSDENNDGGDHVA